MLFRPVLAVVMPRYAVAPDLASSSSPAEAQQPLPALRSGVHGDVLESIQLAAAHSRRDGCTLRMRQVTIEPGGFLPMHSHSDRPAVAYVLRGALTEHFEGESQPRTYSAGQTYAIHTQPHALQNRGEVPVVFLEVDLI